MTLHGRASCYKQCELLFFYQDVKKLQDREKIRSMLGFCPQQNVLFSELTVREHLELFARSKGVQPSLIKAEV
jgi:ABC-type multidrug transport system ATPase subunit